MPVFSYKVKNEKGAVLSGESKVESRERLLELMDQNGFVPVEIIEKNFLTDISSISLFRKKVKLVDLAQFCRQFSIMLEAGISIAGALDVLREQTTNPTLKDCLRDIYANIQKGLSLSTVLQYFPDIFPPILLSMVESGEVSGQLDRVFIRLADHFEKQQKQKQKIQGAMTYPIIILVIAIFVVVIMIVKVIPTFGESLKGMDVELPKLTQVMLNISDFFSANWYVFLIGIIGLVVGLKALKDSEKGKKMLDKLMLKIPLVADLMKTMMTARFSSSLSTLLSSGVLILESLQITQKILNNSIVVEKMNNAIEKIEQGRSLTESVSEMAFFPPLVLSMLKTGEEAGNMDFTLEKAAIFYEDQLEVKIQKMTSFIEPLIMVALGGVVAFIMFSVLYPMISVYQSMGDM